MNSGLQSSLGALTSSDDERALAAVKEFSELPSTAVAAALRELEVLLADASADTRWWAVRALVEIPHGEVPLLLLKALDDQDSSVRQCAALGLRLHPSADAVPALTEALDDGDHLVRILAADALVAIGEPAVPALLHVLANGNRISRLGSVRALGKIGDPRAIPALFAALDEDSSLMEYWANEGLERMGVGMAFFNPT